MKGLSICMYPFFPKLPSHPGLCSGFSCCRAQALAVLHVESSRTRDQTRVLCIGRQILNHWTTREVPNMEFRREAKKNLLSTGSEAHCGRQFSEGI